MTTITNFNKSNRPNKHVTFNTWMSWSTDNYNVHITAQMMKNLAHLIKRPHCISNVCVPVQQTKTSPKHPVVSWPTVRSRLTAQDIATWWPGNSGGARGFIEPRGAHDAAACMMAYAGDTLSFSPLSAGLATLRPGGWVRWCHGLPHWKRTMLVLLSALHVNNHK